MKNPGAKRFLSWLMSIVMVVGEFGGMPLVTSAQEDTQEEVIEEVLEDEAAEEEVALGASEEEEVVVAEDDIVVEEDAQNDPVQIDVRPQKDVENGVYTWAPLAQIADYDDGWSSDDGKFYLNNTGYGIGVSTNATSAPEDILWISGTALYRTGEKDNYSAEGCVSINKLITEMVACKVTGDIDFQNGDYYVYVGCGDPYSKASDAPFAFSYSEDGTAPVAGWHEYRDNFVRFDNAQNRWFWWDEDYRKENNIPDDEPIPDYPEVCPDGYFSKNNYKLVMKDSENAGAIGYIVRAMNGGKILDRNIGEGEEQIFAIYEEEREGNSTCTYTLIDDFAGFEIAAIRGNGQISGFVSPVKMAPWEAEEFRTWDAVLNGATKYHFGYDFEAPEFSHNHGTWTDDRGTETVTDDIEHVDKFGYNVYVNKPDASRDESRWVELWIENETVRKVTGEGENAVITDTSTINTYAVLIEMNKKYLEDTAAGIQSFEEGVYDVWIVTGDDSGSYYNTNSFQVNFEYPDDNTPGKEVTYNWHPVWIKDTENGIEEYERQKIDNEDGTYRDEDDEEIYAKMATEEYKDYREMKMVDLSTVFYTTSYSPTGFIIKTLNGKKIQNWNGSTTDTFAVPLYYRNTENPEMNCSFMVPADFRINKDATITYITKGSKGTCNAVAGHWYDDIEVEDFVNNYLGKFILTPFAGSVSMVPDNKDNPDGPKHAEYTEKYWYDMQISYLDDPDGLQDINWYNYLIRLKSETEIEVDIAEIITQIVRDRIEADITAGERGNSDLLAGRYEVVFIAGDQNGPYARSFPQLIDLTKLAEIADMDTPQALYRNGEDWFRLIKDGDDWHWQSINDYYHDPERVEYQIKEDENHIIEWWDLTDAQRMSYIHSANASLEENEQFIQKNTMDISLASSGEYAIGYIVRLINNRFVYNAEDGSVVESRMRGDEADPGRNMETHLGGIIEAPIANGKLMVAAIYADGSVSDWYYGRERQDWDEWPQIEMHLTNNAGVISWDQEYKRDEFDNILYWDNEHTNPQLDGGVDIYVADPEGIWYRVDAYYDWDTEHNKASIKLADVLTNMTYMKLRGYAAFKSGTYTLYVVKHTNNGDRASESDIEFNFKPTADKNANFTAVYKEHQKWIKAVPDDDHFNFDEKDVNTDGYTATIQYETLIKTAADNIAGYVVNMPNGIMDANENEAVYYSWFPYNHQAEGFYTARTWEYSAAPGEVKIAAIYTDGTMSEWVTAEPWSKADDYEAVDMGISYDNVTARFAVNPEKLAALKIKLADYSHEGAQAEWDGYTQIANAAIVIRGVENYDIGSRVLKNGEDFRADDQFLPVRAAVDELMFKAGQKNTWDDDQGHHEEPWKYLVPGTYKAAFVIQDQWAGQGDEAHMTAPGMASDQEISFTYKKGEAVTTPARGSATYSYEDRDDGRDYRVHVSSASDEAVAYIVRYKDGNIYRYDEGITNGNGDFGFFMKGQFAENYDAELAVCAVNMYGDISGFIDVVPEVSVVTENSINATGCNTVYQVGYTGQLTLDGATVTVSKFDTDGTTGMEIYELAEQTGGNIDFTVGDGDKFVDDDDFAVANNALVLKVKLYGGRLNNYNNNIFKTLGTVTLQVKAITITSVTSNLTLDKNSYFVGQTPSLGGGSVIITYSDGTSRTIPASNAALRLATPDGEDFDEGAFKRAGNIQIRVLLDNQPIHLKEADEEPSENDFTLLAQVIAREVESITVTPPDKTSYFVGQAVDYTGGVVTALWNDGKTEKISLTSGEVTKGAYDNTEAAVVAISVTYGEVEGMFRVTFVEPEITRIAVTTEPKRDYVEGEAFNPANGVITVYKEYGDPDVVNMTEQGVSYDDITDWAPGVYELNVQYGGKTTTVTITIVAKLINTVALSTQPAKTVYLQGEELDLADGKITVTYSNCATDDVFDLNDIRNQLAISGFRSDEPGNYTVSIIYKGKTVTYNITVKGVIEIAVNTPPTKLNYIVGQELELTGGKLDVTVAGEDEVRVIDITEDMLSDYDLSTAGDKEITVSYGGRTTSFVVHVDPLTATSIVVTAQPTRTEFYLNEDIVVAGGKITVTYNDGTTEVIDMAANMISGYDKTKVGEQTVTVTYGGKTATFKVTVLAKTVSKIEIASAPTKVVYELNADLDITGGKIKLTFNNGQTETIDMTADMISGYDKTKAGKQTITVTYGDKTATFEVTVNEKQEEKPSETPDDDYEFDPTVQEEPVVGEGMKIFFDDATLSLSEDNIYHITYTGKAIKPLVRVTDNRVILTEGIDYIVKYSDNKNAGTATVTVKGKGIYSANETLSFVIDRCSINEVKIGGLVSKSETKVNPVVTFGGKVLKKGRDYKFTIDEGSVEFEGLGNFEGTTTEMIEVLTSKEIKKMGIKVKFSEDMPKEFIYDGLPQTIDEYLIVTDGTGEETTEYEVSYSDNVNAGKVTVLITGNGSHRGKVKKSFRIKPNKAATFDVSYNAEVAYNKNGAKPFIVVSANETFELMTQGRDYTVKYSNNKTGGATASFSLIFKGNYKGAKYTDNTKFLVKKSVLDKAAENVSGNYILVGDMVFGKKGKYQPKAYVVVDGSLVPAKEYGLDYSEKGKLEGPKEGLIVTAQTKDMNYAGKASASYNVVEGTGKTDVNKAKVVLTKSGKSKVYGGAGDKVTLTPGTDFTIKIGKTKIENAADISANFDIFYADNNTSGKATIILKGKGNYVGVFAGNFTIKKAVIKKK